MEGENFLVEVQREFQVQGRAWSESSPCGFSDVAHLGPAHGSARGNGTGFVFRQPHRLLY